MKDVTAAIIQRQGKYLIAQRKTGDPQAGKWEFPGGKVEPYETPEECLERELYEEFGVEASVKRYFCESVYDYGKGSIRLIAYLVDCNAETFQLRVHEAIRWVAPENLTSYELLPADIPIAQKITALE